MLPFALTALLTAAPVSLALPGLTPVNVAEGEATLYGEILSARLGDRGVKVVSARDVRTLLGLDRQKALLGCSETSCIAELSGALGVDGVLVGDVAKLDGTLVLTLKVLRSRDASVITRFDGEVRSSGEMSALLTRAADALAVPLGGTPSTQRGVSKLWALAPALVAAGGLGVGLWAQLEADARLATVRSASSPEQARLAASEGKTLDVLGAVALGVAGAAAVGSVALLVFGDAGAVTPSVSVVPGVGATLSVSGRLP